ncbi:hypothetical protein KIL84_021211 [Mauremys mutica]|uniref:Mast cell-expressed membrane protein 1 n=1 Tax=Mauremys mutica TaxID=74926 RepID=A0A9D3XBG7_9SAUR|nr:hypothetical protein KIL84_021093 [Mauremys mutica]KAH1176477.1 hypothetical protein KIL84_021211 [Mauremys mutica]
MEMNDIYVNHMAVERSPGRRMKRTSPKPAGHGAAEFSDDEMPDYENISVMTDKKNPQAPGEMPPSYPAPTAPSTPQPAKGRTREQKHMLMLYLLMAICFLMWIVLLSLTVVNDQKMTGELKRINTSLSHRINQVSKEVKEAQVQLGKALTKQKAAEAASTTKAPSS